MYTLVGMGRTRSFRVLWMLEELGLSYEHIPASPGSPEACAVNPTGKVPTLVVDGEAITDSTAILTFLADRHGALTFKAGTIERARQDALTHFVLDEMDAVLWTAARHSFVLAEEMRVPEVKDSLKWEFERAQNRFMDRIGEGPFSMGERMTVPDIIACHCAGWAAAAKFPLIDEFKAWSKGLTARDAYKQARAK